MWHLGSKGQSLNLGPVISLPFDVGTFPVLSTNWLAVAYLRGTSCNLYVLCSLGIVITVMKDSLDMYCFFFCLAFY